MKSLKKIINRLLCCLFFHKVYIVREFCRDQRKIGCKRCGKFFAMHDGVKAFVPWDKDFDELYKIMGQFKE
jgi:hypothetical protein